MSAYTYTTQSQVRAAFWQGCLASVRRGNRRGKPHNAYNATIRSEFVAFIDMLEKDRHISESLAQKVTL